MPRKRGATYCINHLLRCAAIFRSCHIWYLLWLRGIFQADCIRREMLCAVTAEHKYMYSYSRFRIFCEFSPDRLYLEKFMRINKYLSECGICSRREADRLVEAGHVSINGKKAAPGSQVEEGDKVLVDGKRAVPPMDKIYLKFYKPTGIVCTFESREKNNLGDYLKYPRRVTYAGRLDKNSEGLLILTDDGDLIQQMMTARNFHEKEYEVTVSRDLTEDFLDRMRGGIYLSELGVTTRPCRIEQTGRRSFRIILTQGLNRQIRRMCRYCGYGVQSLKRIRVVNVQIGDMKPGDLAEMTPEEICGLKARLKGTLPERQAGAADKGCNFTEEAGRIDRYGQGLSRRNR